MISIYNLNKYIISKYMICTKKCMKKFKHLILKINYKVISYCKLKIFIKIKIGIIFYLVMILNFNLFIIYKILSNVNALKIFYFVLVH